MRNHLKNKIFMAIIFSYLLMLLMPVILGGFLYSFTLSNSEDLLKKNNENLLQQTGEILDSIYMEVERISAHISVHDQIMSFSRLDSLYEPQAMSKAIEYISNNVLYPFSLSSSFISEYYIFFNYNELVIGPNLVYPGQKLYEATLRFEDMDFDTWKSRYLNIFQQSSFLPELTIMNDSNPMEVIPYFRSLGSPNDPFGTVLIFLDAVKIKSLLKRIDLGNQGISAIISAHGEVLTSMGENFYSFRTAEDLRSYEDETSFYYTSYSSPISKWTFITIQNKNLIKNKLRYIHLTAIGSIFAVLAIGIFMALILGFKQAKPLSSIQKAIQSTSKEISTVPLKEIANEIQKLINQKDVLEGRLIKHKPQLRASYIENLISGSFNSTTALESMLKYVDIPLSGSYKTVSILSFARNDDDINTELIKELETKKVILRDALKKTLTGQYILHDIGIDQVALIHSADAGSSKSYRSSFNNKLNEIQDYLNNDLFLNITITLSRIYTNIRFISRAFAEAQSLTKFLEEDDDIKLIWYEDCQESSKQIHFPLEQEQKLISAVVAGNSDQTNAILKEIIEGNTLERDLPADVMQIFLQHLKSTAIRILDSASFPSGAGVYDKLVKLHPGTMEADKFLEGIARILKEMAEERNKKKSSRNTKMKNRIEIYLKEHYSDKNLSVVMLSEEFKLSEIYFSRFFKEQFGINFHSYLESARMDKARQLMKDTDLPLKEIIGVVGYASINTFSRAFKRKYGISPSSFRGSL